MPLISVKDAITVLDDFFAEWSPSLDGEPEAYESLKAAVLAQQTNNSQSVAALTELRNDIMQTNLPYRCSWATRINEVIERLNAGVPALHT